jgi:hypothetical protein
VPSQQPEYEPPASSLETLAVCVSVCDVWCGDVWRDESLFGVYAHRHRIPTDIQVNSTEPSVISEPNRTHLLDSIESLASRSPNLKMARFLHHLKRDSTRRLVTLDCLTGEEHMMEYDNDWAADIKSDEGESEFAGSLSQSEIESI